MRTKNYATPKQAAKILGCHVDSLRRLANEGKLSYIKTPGGQRRYDVQGYIDSQTESDITTVCYCRVSGKRQADDSRWIGIAYMRSKFPTAEIIKDYESGINFKRKELQTLLERIMREDKLRIIVACRDRLARFSGEVIQFLVEQNGREANECGVIVIDVCEAHTSKTVSWTGDVIGNLGGQKTIKDGVGNVMDRDLNGARGIFVKNIASALKVLPIS